jgi:hypothetical protein
VDPKIRVIALQFYDLGAHLRIKIQTFEALTTRRSRWPPTLKKFSHSFHSFVRSFIRSLKQSLSLSLSLSLAQSLFINSNTFSPISPFRLWWENSFDFLALPARSFELLAALAPAIPVFQFELCLHTHTYRSTCCSCLRYGCGMAALEGRVCIDDVLSLDRPECWDSTDSADDRSLCVVCLLLVL